MINKDLIYKKLCEVVSQENIKMDEAMSNHISFRAGGNASILVEPESKEELKKIISILKEDGQEFFVMGNGSNLLVRDGGLKTVVIKISEKMQKFEIEGNKVVAEPGILLSRLSKAIMQEELEGFEFASGIPGTIGGAVVMNAGAYGGEMKDVVKSVELMDMNGEIREYTNEEMEFGYRKSKVTSGQYIVVGVKIELEKGSYDEIKSRMDELTVKRTTKQPLALPSAGSTFKRPEGYYAGKLIEDSGLKGITYKGAQVSDLHSGFIVNRDNASATDIIHLIDFVKKTVYDKFNVKLEEEVKIIGEDLN